MNITEMEDYRKCVAHHCQTIMRDVMTLIEKIQLTHKHPENSYQYLARYQDQLRRELREYMNGNWWGRNQ